MLFRLKREEAKSMELLQKKNIILNCTSRPKDQVIDEIGTMLYESGYVDKDYIEAMKKREESCSTNIGNGIALPHGVEEAKRTIKRSGIAVMIFPEGTMWNDEPVSVVIGIAGVGDSHLDILANIAELLSEPEAVEELIRSDVDMIHALFTGEGR